MKILFLNVGAELGGAERSLLDLMASLREAQPSIELHLVVSADGPLVEGARQFGVHSEILPMPASLTAVGDSGLRGGAGGILRLGAMAPTAVWGAWRYSRRLARLVNQLRPDVVHSNSIKFHLLTTLSRPSGTRVVWHIRDFLGTRALVARVLRWTRGPDGALAISQAVADDMRRVLPDVPVEIVYNAIDVNHFRPGPAEGPSLDTLAGLSAAKPNVVRIGLIATYAKWKGQDIFLEAAAQLESELADDVARFYIIGGPIYKTHGSQWSRDELRQRAEKLSLRHLGLIDFQSDPLAVYRGLDIVVHASTRPEPFGRTVVEAMACGRAVVVAEAGGAAELFTAGHDALGVPPNSPRALADQLRILIANREKRESLGHQARLTAVARFARERLGPQVLEAYERFSKDHRIGARR